jgi:NDP-sugar pyrophosphorylase family protein
MTERIIIMAGGMSSRMKKATPVAGLSPDQIRQANQGSKGLIELGRTGQSLLHFLLHNIRAAGFTKVFLVTGEKAEPFRSLFGRNEGQQPLEVNFATQYIPSNRYKPLGTADAVYQAMQQFPELQENPFAVCNSDNLYSSEALQAIRNTDHPHACIAYDRDALEFDLRRVAAFALAKFDSDYHLVDIVEKPDPDRLEEYRDHQGKLRISMNLFKFDGAQFFPHLEACPLHPVRQEKELPTAVRHLLQERPNCLVGIPFSEHVPDLTSKEDIQKVVKFLTDR